MARKKKERKARKPRDPNKPRKYLSDNTLVLGALRKAFARSSNHRAVVQAMIIEHSDPERPRVETWCRCPECGKPEAKSYIQVDHIDPVRPIGVHVDEMTKEEILARVFCGPSNLKGTCKPCHQIKTNAENAERRKIRTAKKKALR